MNIYTKLTLLCLVLVLSSSSILLFFVNRKFQSTLRKEILSGVQVQAEESISNIERFIYDRFNEIRVSSRSSLEEISLNGTEAINEELKELESLNNLFYSFSYFTVERIKVGDSKSLNIGEQQPYSQYWIKLNEDNPIVMDISKSESLGRIVMHFASMVDDLQGEPAGVLVGRVLIDELYTFLGSISVSQSRKMDVNLVDQNGVILYSNSNPDGVLEEVYPEYDLISNLQGERVNFLDAEDKLYFVAKQQDFRDYIGNNWTLIIGIDKSDAFGPLIEMRKSLVLIVISVLIGSILLALIAANLFVRPIVKLSKAADELSRGNLEVDMDFNSRDEVGKLAKQLSKTSQILIKRIEEQRKLNQKLEDQKDEIAKQKEQIEATNLQLTDSISYARRIQRSILPELKNLKRVTRDAMIFYQPKDIISGDFFWFERVRKGRSDFLVAVCADCTGHGVPGAIMSIMGSNQLTNIVYYQNYLEPKRILARLDKAIKFELYSRDDNQETQKDGMEIGVLAINLDDYVAEYAGAGMPLYMVRGGQLEVFKSIKEMVGAIKGEEREVEAQLENHVIELKKGDRFYMATDGFQDQFGGPEDKKFMAKTFRNLLIEYQDTPLKEQDHLFREILATWKGNTPQTDDVLVMGFEL